MSDSRADAMTDAVASAAGSWRRATGIAGAAIGVLAAGAAAGVAVERMTVGRAVRRKARLALDSAGPYGTLRGTPGKAYADDGTELYYEVDEVAPDTGGTPSARRLRLFGRKAPAPVTVVFCHGYCLNQDSWHFQRAALRGVVRTVHWDQRSHGRSGRGVAQSRDREPLTIDQLGRDLKAVVDAAAPEGPLVLVGHSMGGMTVMALAAQYPELIAERVAATAFVGTSSGRLGEVNFGCRWPVSTRYAGSCRGCSGRSGSRRSWWRRGAGRRRSCSPGSSSGTRSPGGTSTRRWSGSPSG